MATRYVPILGKDKHATTISKILAHIITQLWVVQENQFQILKSEDIPSLKRAFTNVNQKHIEELETLAKDEIDMALKYNFDNYESSVKVEKDSNSSDFKVVIGVVIIDENGDTHQANEILNYDGNVFKSMLKQENLYER